MNSPLPVFAGCVSHMPHVSFCIVPLLAMGGIEKSHRGRRGEIKLTKSFNRLRYRAELRRRFFERNHCAVWWSIWFYFMQFKQKPAKALSIKALVALVGGVNVGLSSCSNVSMGLLTFHGEITFHGEKKKDAGLLSARAIPMFFGSG